MDARSKRTGEHSAEIVKLMADAAAMRAQMDALEGRVLRLESELAAARKSVLTGGAAAHAPSAPRASKRPPPMAPPPLPKFTPSITTMPEPKSAGRRSVVDISEIAELVDSVPPPSLRSKK